MKRSTWNILVLLAALLMVSPQVQAQGRLYNPSAEETLEGTVQRIETVQSTQTRCRWGGIHVLLRQDDGTDVAVHLGPTWYIDEQELALQVGDAVTVLGAPIVLDETTEWIARTVTRGEQTMQLRDDQGLPLWRGMQGGRGMGRMGRL